MLNPVGTVVTPLIYIEGVEHVHDKDSKTPMSKDDFDKAFASKGNKFIPDKKDQTGDETFQAMLKTVSMRFRNPKSGFVKEIVDGGHRIIALSWFKSGLIPLIIQHNGTKLVVFYNELKTHPNLRDLYDAIRGKPFYVCIIDKDTPLVSFSLLS